MVRVMWIWIPDELKRLCLGIETDKKKTPLNGLKMEREHEMISFLL